MICQHLDDICSAAAEKEVLEKFDEAFITVAAELGVKLAPRDDHDPCRKGSGLRGGVRHGGVDVGAGTLYATAQDRGGTDSDAST